MAQTYADLEEPLFLDEPLEVPKRAVKDTADLDALFACEEEPAQVEPTVPANPGNAGKAASAWKVLAVILAGVAVGFALVLTFLK